MGDSQLFPWLAAPAAALISMLVLALLLTAGKGLPHDHPNARSLHRRPVLRVGGIAIWAGFLPIALLAPEVVPGRSIWVAAWFAVTTVSLVDDWRGVHPALRLAVQVAAAAAVTAVVIGPGRAQDFGLVRPLAHVGAILAIVWAANLYNFMDGSDGLAATMAIGGFGAYAAAATMSGIGPEPYLALAAATVPFLAVNLPPARTFMGDVGSVPLGFLAAAFGLAGVAGDAWPPWFPLLVFLPFIADATLTLVGRMARRERVFEAHKMHYYQRLNRMGAGHRGTLVVYALLIIGTAASAVLALAHARGAGWIILAAWIAAIGLVFAGIDYHWRKRFPER